jgi:hypothetical protein
MTKCEKLLAAIVLEWAADSFSNHGCNDVEQRVYAEAEFTDADKAKLLRDMREYNNQDEPWPEKLSQIGDSSLMGFFADKLRKEAGSGQVKSVTQESGK